MTSRRLTAVAAALALLAPASALAQSAGDDQYRDPFGEDGQQQDSGAGEAPQTGSDTGSGTTGGDSTPAPAAAPGPAPATAPGTAPAEPVATTAGSLPRTGLGAGVVAGLGVLLLAAGVGLRRASGG